MTDRAQFQPYPPEVRARAVELHASGMSKAAIARELGISRPTLQNWLKAEPATPDSMSVEDAGDAIIRNITEAKGRRRARRGPDPAPRQQAPAAGSSGATPDKVTDQQLTDMLAEMLCFPAVPAKLFLHCDFCAAHFADSGGPAAVELVRMAQTSPGLRRSLTTMYGVYRTLMAGGVLGLYVGRPLLHHLAPAPVLALAGPVVGVPPRASMMGDSRVSATPVHSPHGPDHAPGNPHPSQAAGESEAA